MAYFVIQKDPEFSEDTFVYILHHVDTSGNITNVVRYTKYNNKPRIFGILFSNGIESWRLRENENLYNLFLRLYGITKLDELDWENRVGKRVYENKDEGSMFSITRKLVAPYFVIQKEPQINVDDTADGGVSYILHYVDESGNITNVARYTNVSGYTWLGLVTFGACNAFFKSDETLYEQFTKLRETEFRNLTNWKDEVGKKDFKLITDHLNLV